MKNYQLLWSAIMVVALIITGCDSYPSKNQTTPSKDYVLQGTLVRDANMGYIRSAVRVDRNDTLLTTGILLFGSDSLKFNHSLGITDSIYSHKVAPDTVYPAGNFNLTLIDPGKYADTLPVAVTGGFAMTITDPPNHQWRPTDGALALDWSGSSMADGYVMAAVKASKVYTGKGHSLYADQQVTAGTFRADSAFYINAGATLDTGLYYVYVYSFWGSPDKALADQLLPTPIPSQLADNIAADPITGHFGSITVAAYDTIRVLTQ